MGGGVALNACTTFLSSSLLLRLDSRIHEEIKERKKSVDLQVKKKKHASRHPPMPQLVPVVESLPVVLCAGDDCPSRTVRPMVPPPLPACCLPKTTAPILHSMPSAFCWCVSGSDSCPPTRSCIPLNRCLAGGSTESLSSEEETDADESSEFHQQAPLLSAFMAASRDFNPGSGAAFTARAGTIDPII